MNATKDRDREQCYICGMTYSNRNTLYVHMHSKHREQARKLDTEQLDGVLCNYEGAGNNSVPHPYTSIKDMESHGVMQSVTKASGNQVLNIQKRPEPSFNFREHICNICAAVFDRPKKLATHKKKHSVATHGDGDSNITAAGKEGTGEGHRVTNSTHKKKHIVEGQGDGEGVSNIEGQGGGGSNTNAAAGKEGMGEGAGDSNSAPASKPDGVCASMVEGAEEGVPNINSIPLGQESSSEVSDSSGESNPSGAPVSSAATQDDDHGVSNSVATENNPGEVGNATTRDQDDRVPNFPSVGKVDGVSNSVVVACKPNDVPNSNIKDQASEVSTEGETVGISITAPVGQPDGPEN